MNTYYCIIDSKGNYIFSNFPQGLSNLIGEYKGSKNIIKVDTNGISSDARIGMKSSSHGTIYLLTLELKYVKRYKLFKELLHSSILALEPLLQLKQSIIDAHNNKNEELIHNITSLNTYSIQTLFSLIPQNVLTANINAQKEAIKGLVAKQIDNTVDALLKLIKYNLAMKVEFSVFERTQKPNASVKKISHSIRSLVLSILQIFIDDFNKKDIEVSLDAGSASERRLEIDDDSMFVSLFYILENSVKYCCPGTKYKIIFEEDFNCFYIIFKMISIRIEENEIHRLVEHSYRSPLAQRINENGKGLGMYRITKTLSLNNAELIITPRVNDGKREINGVQYEGNQFKIKFKEQVNWFKKN